MSEPNVADLEAFIGRTTHRRTMYLQEHTMVLF
jgi:hypothetical protein